MSKFAFVAPSGAGKTTIISRIKERLPYYHIAKSYTTRNKRHEEDDEYFFTKKANFQNLIKKDFFFEWEEIFHHFYGTPKVEIEKEFLILNLDINGFLNLRQKINLVGIGILPPSIKILKKRLFSRDLIIDHRKDKFLHEFEAMNQLDYLVINDNMARCIRDVLNIVQVHEKKREAKLLINDLVKDLS